MKYNTRIHCFKNAEDIFVAFGNYFRNKVKKIIV